MYNVRWVDDIRIRASQGIDERNRKKQKTKMIESQCDGQRRLASLNTYVLEIIIIVFTGFSTQRTRHRSLFHFESPSKTSLCFFSYFFVSLFQGLWGLLSREISYQPGLGLSLEIIGFEHGPQNSSKIKIEIHEFHAFFIFSVKRRMGVAFGF